MSDHKSDCARYDESAYGIGPCTCGAIEQLCSVASVVCSKAGDWAILADDGKTFVSCDDHIAWLLYGDGGVNRVFAIDRAAAIGDTDDE